MTARWKLEIVIDPIACDGHGVCAEVFPERIERDRWGFPIVDAADITPVLQEHAERAVRVCPRHALHLVERPC